MLSRRLVAVKNTLSISWAVHEITSCFGYQKSPPLIAKGLKNILSNTHAVFVLPEIQRGYYYRPRNGCLEVVLHKLSLV